MAMTIQLQDEFGETIQEVHDTKGVIVSFLPSLDDHSYHCLRFIDPYGDAYFNRVQMVTFLAEWERLIGGMEGEGVKELLKRVKALAQRCQHELHLYLKFVGD